MFAVVGAGSDTVERRGDSKVVGEGYFGAGDVVRERDGCVTAPEFVVVVVRGRRTEEDVVEPFA